MHVSSFRFPFSGIFREGNLWIYPILDWSRPDKAIVWVFGILATALAAHIFLFWVYKFREFIHRRYFGIKLNLTTESIDKQITHSKQTLYSNKL